MAAPAGWGLGEWGVGVRVAAHLVDFLVSLAQHHLKGFTEAVQLLVLALLVAGDLQEGRVHVLDEQARCVRVSL